MTETHTMIIDRAIGVVVVAFATILFGAPFALVLLSPSMAGL